MVVMGDPLLAGQLKEGFHQIEFGQWRWTTKKFSVALRVPAKDKAHPQLWVKLTVPKSVIAHSKQIALSCLADGKAIATETYSKAGDYSYKHNFTPPAADAIQVDCELDNAIPPGAVDTRELGIIVWNIGITPGG